MLAALYRRTDRLAVLIDHLHRTVGHGVMSERDLARVIVPWTPDGDGDLTYRTMLWLPSLLLTVLLELATPADCIAPSV
jgi:hypothetical protein